MPGEPVDEGVTALLARLATERTEFERTSAQPNDMEWLGRRFELMFDADQALRAAYVDSLDRLEIVEGRPQRFGMFYRVVDGQRVSYPTADPERLAERRAAMDLGTTTFRR